MTNPPQHPTDPDAYFQGGKWRSAQDDTFPCCMDPDRCARCGERADINGRMLCSVCSADDPKWGPVPSGHEAAFAAAVAETTERIASREEYKRHAAEKRVKALEERVAELEERLEAARTLLSEPLPGDPPAPAPAPPQVFGGFGSNQADNTASTPRGFGRGFGSKPPHNPFKGFGKA